MVDSENAWPAGASLYRAWRWMAGAWMALAFAAAGCSPSDEVSAAEPQNAARKAGGVMTQVTDVQVREVKIPTRDGRVLAADVWLPRGTGPFPVVLMMTPYNRKLVGAPLPNQQVRLDLPDRTRFAFVIVDWRGYFGSKAARGLRPPTMVQHGQDGYDIVEWIARQDFCDGHVGMWGPSALGKVQYAVAANHPPHLDCIVPLAAAFGYSYEQFYYGGALRQGYIDTLSKVGYGPQLMVKAHPGKDAFWTRIEQATRRCDTLDLPVLMITGWFDLDADAVIQTFQDIESKARPEARKQARLVIGPWQHIALGKTRQGDLLFPEARGASVDESNRDFDRYLRGIKPDAAPPRVRYFQMGTNRWLTAETFPPPPAGQTVYYLDGDAALATQPPRSKMPPSQFRYDPLDPSPTLGGMNAFLPSDPRYRSVGAGPRDQRPVIERRTDSCVFTTPVLTEDVFLGGRAEARVFMSSDRVDTDLAVRLCDVYPDGRSMLVTDGIRRLRFRKSLAKPQWLTPGEVVEVTVELAITAQVFLKGHRIRIILTSANYPRFDVNPNVERRLLGPKQAIATNHIYHDPNHPSSLILPSWRTPTTDR